ncbi:hypothetical protein BDV95DRAFT_225384 [Massariosphaeria phaeospora]|uniref:Uncharacterized protein n=1 Tax=Massariosphaeria phaeospora TaxID=100035 RepID=A0A7C8IN54_9PLEO|nr:hypothetical protein BDV95DRAFT_225384 [Massariosphaeria phaeospora]
MSSLRSQRSAKLHPSASPESEHALRACPITTLGGSHGCVDNGQQPLKHQSLSLLFAQKVIFAGGLCWRLLSMIADGVGMAQAIRRWQIVGVAGSKSMNRRRVQKANRSATVYSVQCDGFTVTWGFGRLGSASHVGLCWGSYERFAGAKRGEGSHQ